MAIETLWSPSFNTVPDKLDLQSGETTKGVSHWNETDIGDPNLDLRTATSFAEEEET